MAEFIAYHSAAVMGRTYAHTSRVRFFSKKRGVLERAVGERVWVLAGVREGGVTRYHLHGTFRPKTIVPDGDGFVIAGPAEEMLTPPKDVTTLQWFRSLRERAANFSTGFSALNDDAIIAELIAVTSGRRAAREEDAYEALEGSAVVREHLRRERDQSLVTRAKQHWARRDPNLPCEVCGFSFRLVYGDLGDGFVEAHHRVPLGQLTEARANRVEDLAAVCANCHRMLHAQPELTLDELRRRRAKRGESR